MVVVGCLYIGHSLVEALSIDFSGMHFWEKTHGLAFRCWNGQWRYMRIILFLGVLLVANILRLLMFPKMVADVDDCYSILLTVSCVSLFFLSHFLII